MTPPKPLLKLTCKCGKKFTQSYPTQTHCEPDCRRKYNEMARRERNKANGVRRGVKVAQSKLSLPARLDLVVIRAWRNADEYTRAKIAALNPRMQFVEEI